MFINKKTDPTGKAALKRIETSEDLERAYIKFKFILLL